MAQYKDLIPQNTAPVGTRAIGVYDPAGKRVGEIPLGHLTPPNVGEMLYRFGALSDVHISQDTAEADFLTAMGFFQDTEKADFVCIAGDLTQYAKAEEFQQYADCVARFDLPVYPVGGNHDAYGSGLTDATFRQYTGFGTFYTVTKGDDVFLMLSSGAWPSQSGKVQPFYASGLQALYNALEENRNRRCFVFQHYFPWGHAGDPLACYGSNALWGTQGEVLYSLMAHYRNALWFHGHSHHMFQAQSLHDKATYDFDFGCHSIHIPSCALPVEVTADGTRTQIASGSQGYVVDVYQNHVILRGRDFVNGTFLPVATYCLDTHRVDISAGTYVDSTGTISM